MNSIPFVQYLAERGRLDWRIPDEYGCSERNLDCRQLCALEVMKWKGEKNPVSIFLDPFNAVSDRLMLRRAEPVLHHPWKLTAFPALQDDKLQHLVRSIFEIEGYCLLYYKAVNVPFSAYHGKHDVIHWLLLADLTDTQVTVIDDTGLPPYFDGYQAVIPNHIFFPALQASGHAGAAILRHQEEPATDLGLEWFPKLAAQSATQMLQDGGLDSIAHFADALEQAERAELLESLEQLEFDVHYFRKLRVLWDTAVEQKNIPERYLKPEWTSALKEACNQWSYAVGVLMKWKRQPERDYRQRLVGYIHDALAAEERLAQELKQLSEVSA
ncbi:hypothetical protein [Paenibacillus sp. FSL K6-1230]|uniref:hypothetical protein n=1 Tax=Paenibacillus sp. FSL K6-1230 TaxID=2921603 RepID=UPI0030F85C48